MEAVLGSLGVLLIIFLFCLTILDIALRSVRYDKIRSIQRRGNQKAHKLLTLLASPERAISVLLFLKYTASAAFFLLLGTLVFVIHVPVIYKVAAGPFILLASIIFLEYVPRMLAVHNPERAAFAMLTPFELLLKLNRVLPLPQISERIASRFLRLYGFNGQKIFSEYSVNEIKMFVHSGRLKEETEIRREPMYKLSDFNGGRVREVMKGRPMVKALDVHTRLDIALMIMQDSGHSRMPVFRGSLDNILGILHVKDIIGVPHTFSIEQYLRKPFFIPKSASIQAAFQTMRRNRAHLAIVIDEYGGVDGIVTLEDLIEELIGEIQDEHDNEVEQLHQVNEGTWLIEGDLPIKDLNQNLNLDLPENSCYTTVAGFLISMMDKIPAENEKVDFGNLQFAVEKMKGNQITTISLRLTNPPNDTSVL